MGRRRTRGSQQQAGAPGRLGPAEGAPSGPAAGSGDWGTPRRDQTHRLDPAWTDCSDAALLLNLSAWCGPHLGGLRRLDDLGRLNLADILLSLLRWDQRAALDEWAPSHIEVASGSRIAVDYSDPEAPVVAVRLQELFGVTETPRVGRGTVPVTLHLLSPASRPVQVTRDLAGFWRTTYFDVRKDLRGRYPKHHWPDNPLEAEPTSRTRRRG
jgi:ATP-dependent helicase HrpB